MLAKIQDKEASIFRTVRALQQQKMKPAEAAKAMGLIKKMGALNAPSRQHHRGRRARAPNKRRLLKNKKRSKR